MNCIKKIAYVYALLCMTGAVWGMDIFQAARNGNIARVSKLLAAVPEDVRSALVQQQSDNGDTPLHLAAMNGHEQIVLRLIGAGADVNQQDDYGCTALHLAVRNMMAYTRVNPQETPPWAGRLHREAIVCRLIESCADINQKDDYGKTAVDLAVELRQPTTVRLLNDYIQRIEQARQRAPVIAHTLALATNGRLSAASPLALLPQALLRYITRLAVQAEEADARRPRQANGAAVI